MKAVNDFLLRKNKMIGGAKGKVCYVGSFETNEEKKAWG
jgi:hypothetical protein